jgi:hypothetical protein
MTTRKAKYRQQQIPYGMTTRKAKRRQQQIPYGMTTRKAKHRQQQRKDNRKALATTKGGVGLR